MHIDILNSYPIDRDFITLIMRVINDDNNLMSDSQLHVKPLSSTETKDCSTGVVNDNLLQL